MPETDTQTTEDATTDAEERTDEATTAEDAAESTDEASTDEATTTADDDAESSEESREDEHVRLTKDEYARLRRQEADYRRYKKRQEAERKRAEEERAKEEGRWKELAEAKEAELADLRRERDEAERSQMVVAAATRLHFQDPADAASLLRGVDLDDEVAVESALERLATEKPYLIQRARQRQTAPINPAKPETGNGQRERITLADARKRSEEEPDFAKRWRKGEFELVES